MTGSYKAILVILLLGAFLRWSGLGPMSDMLSYDEAYNGVDTLSLLRSPRLTPFFPSNHGRESLWCYVLIPFVAVWGARPFALRLAATMMGVLTLAAMYRLGKELLNTPAACWATLALGISQWHVHQSRTALRAILLPLIGALAFAALLQAYRANKPVRWIYAGIWIGLLTYTYFAAVLWILYALTLLAWWWFSDQEKRRGLVITFLVAGLLFLPMLVYGFSHPQETLQRPEAVRVSTLNEVWDNVRLWGKALFHQGDPDARYNPISRPVVDPVLIPAFLAGIVGLWWVVKRRWHVFWIAGLVFVSILPSLLTRDAPHFLRAVGLTIPVALVVGAGGWGLEWGIRRLGARKWAPVFPLILFVIAGIATYHDFNDRWLHHPEVFTLMEQHANQASNFINASVEERPVYFSPFTPSHPVIAFRSADLAPRHVGAFDSHFCLVIPDTPAIYVSLTMYEPNFRQRISPWAETTVLTQDPYQTPPRYTVFQAIPRPEFLYGPFQARMTFGEAVELHSLTPIPSVVEAGSTVLLNLGLKALRPLDRVYSVFVHLYGDPTPYEGGPLWAQGDSLVCAPYPSVLWRTDETVVQPFKLTIPADIPAGRYLIAVGMYEAPAGARLPLNVGDDQADFFVLQEVEIKVRPTSP